MKTYWMKEVSSQLDPKRQAHALIMQIAVKTTKLVKKAALHSVRVPENAF